MNGPRDIDIDKVMQGVHAGPAPNDPALQPFVDEVLQYLRDHPYNPNDPELRFILAPVDPSKEN